MKPTLHFPLKNFSPLRGPALLLVLTIWIAMATVPAQTAVAVAEPAANLVIGNDGNFYRTSRTGGVYDSGTFFRVTPDGVTTVLYHFTGGTDGGAPNDSLVAGSDGDFYGTTALGGSSGSGNAFQVTASGVLSTLFGLGGGTGTVTGFVRGNDDHLFDGQAELDGETYYLSFPSGNFFGYYAFLADANYIYHSIWATSTFSTRAMGGAASISTISPAVRSFTRHRLSRSRTCTTSAWTRCSIITLIRTTQAATTRTARAFSTASTPDKSS